MSRLEHLIPIKQGVEVSGKSYLALQVYYRKDGQRGIYMAVTPITMEPTSTPGLNWRVYSGFVGSLVVKIEDAARLNQKRVQAVMDQAVADYNAKQGTAWELIQKVLEQNGKELAEAA